MITPVVGQTVYITSRHRVRAGKGISAVKVSELVYATCMGVRGVVSFYAGRSLYGIDEAYETREDATTDLVLTVADERKLERARYDSIFARLDRAMQAAASGA